MELPVVNFPEYIEEFSEDFTDLFQQERQLTHFKQLMTGYAFADKKTVAHMNGLFTDHTNQSNLNRFITDAQWDELKMNKVKINMINHVEHDGVVVLDDFIVEKYGTEIYGVENHFDHSSGETVRGWQIADCVYSGKGIYPLLSSVYLRKNSRWRKPDEEFKSKIDLQMDHLSSLDEMNLDFSYVVMDIWYFCKKLTQHIEKMEKDWIAGARSNRLVKSNRKWSSLKQFAEKMINKVSFKLVLLGDKKYLMKAFTVHMKRMGKVRVLISLNKHGNFRFYVTNRLDWNELDIATRFSRRWDIEVWHRDGKGNYGIKDCQLRSDEGVSKHLTLSMLADTLLEIASLLSPVYAMLQNQSWTPELKHRWVLTELVRQLISSVQKRGGDKKVKKIMESILCPYKSTMRKGSAG